MSEISSNVAPSATKACKVCGEEIKADARKCVHCDSYQDWHANISVSSTVLSLLVALISVLATGLPIVKQTFTPKNSSLSFSFQGASGDLLSVLVTNQGIRPGSIGDEAQIRVRAKGSSYDCQKSYWNAPDGDMLCFAIILTNKLNGAAILIEPGKSILLNYKESPRDVGSKLKSTDNKQMECTALVPNTDFRATETTASVPIKNCDVIKWWIYDHNHM